MWEDSVRHSRLFYLQLFADLDDEALEARKRAAITHFRTIGNKKSVKHANNNNSIAAKISQWMRVIGQNGEIMDSENESEFRNQAIFNERSAIETGTNAELNHRKYTHNVGTNAKKSSNESGSEMNSLDENNVNCLDDALVDEGNSLATVSARNVTTSRSFTLRAGGYLARQRLREHQAPQPRAEQHGQEEESLEEHSKMRKYFNKLKNGVKNRKSLLLRLILTLLITLTLFFVLSSAIKSRLYRRRQELISFNEADFPKPQLAMCISDPFDSKLSSLANNEKELKALKLLMSFTTNPFGPLPPQSQVRPLAELYNALISKKLRLDVRRNRRVLRQLTPKCVDIIDKCVVEGLELDSNTCCSRLVSPVPSFVAEGLCYTVKEEIDSNGSPIRPMHHLPLLKMFIKQEVFDNHQVFLAASTKDRSLSVRNVNNDVFIEQNRENRLSVKLIVEERGNFMEKKCNPKDFESPIPSSSCRLKVVQMISERSVNCSLISLPRQTELIRQTEERLNSKSSKVVRPNSICGPIEGLALAFILGEQEALVTSNEALFKEYESNIFRHCTWPCTHSEFELQSFIKTKVPHKYANNNTLITILPHINNNSIRVTTTRLSLLDLLLDVLLPFLLIFLLLFRVSSLFQNVIGRRRQSLFSRSHNNALNNVQRVSKLSKNDIEHVVWQDRPQV